MAAQSILKTQGRLQVDPAATVGLGREGGAAEGLLTDIGREPTGGALGHRQADPINRHAVPEGQLGRIELRAPRDAQPQTAAAALQLSGGLNQPSEHAVA